MVPSKTSIDLAHRLPNAELVLYKEAGYWGIFQYHEAFVGNAMAFWRHNTLLLEITSVLVTMTMR
jgi:hypothetical protein